MLISVIVPCFNMSKFLPEALCSVLSQSFDDFEILVVDDGSAMAESVRIGEICLEHGVKYFWQPHSGVSRAMNAGVEFADGEFVVCLGADDRLHPSYLEKCLQHFHEGVGFIYSGCQEFGCSARIRLPVANLNRFNVYAGAGGQLGAMMLRKDAWKSVGGFDEKLKGYEDWDLTIRLLQKGWKGYGIPEVLHYCRIHESNSSRNAVNFYGDLKRKHPIMLVAVPLIRAGRFASLVLSDPRLALKRLRNKVSPVPPDVDLSESQRVDERLGFGLDIGSGKNKICGLGCDIRKVSDVQCDARFLPFKGDAFVFAVLRHSLEHVPEYQRALDEAKRVARSVYVFLPKKDFWKADPSHVPFFTVEGECLKSYDMGELYKVERTKLD